MNISSPVPLNSFKGKPFLPSSTFATCTIWFTSRRRMSGKPPLTCPQATTNTSSCPLASPMPLLSSKVNDVLRDTLRFVFVYLDDILIFLKSHKEHAHHVQSVLQHLLENSMSKLRNASSTPHQSHSWVTLWQMAGSKWFSAVTSWLVPSSLKQLQ